MNALKKIAATCRWTARIFGTLLVMLILLIAIGEGMLNLFTQPVQVQIGFLALAFILIGILAGWRWELAGGIMSLFGWCLFFASVMTLRRMTWFVAMLALPGMLYVISALLRGSKNSPG
jgi:hypothetical protein